MVPACGLLVEVGENIDQIAAIHYHCLSNESMVGQVAVEQNRQLALQLWLWKEVVGALKEVELVQQVQEAHASQVELASCGFP